MTARVPIILLVLLHALLVFKSCIECMPDGVTQTTIEKELNYIPVTDTLTKGNDKMQKQLCGRIKAVMTPVRREMNGLDHDGDYSEDETIDDLHLDKILGGSYTTYGEIPWMATILYSNTHLCGGAIISEFWILSAAHCFYGHYNRTLKIAVGDHRLRYMDDYEEIFYPKNVVVHDQFASNKYEYDIALVKIKAKRNGRGIQFNNHVQPICLANSGENPEMHSLMLFSGFGFTSTENAKSTVLKKAFLPIMSPGLCKYIYEDTYSVTSICAGYINGNIDLCAGDSGGPAVYKRDDFYIIYGVATGSTGCRLPNYPVVLTNVATFRGWIDDTINKNSSDSEKIMPVRN